MLVAFAGTEKIVISCMRFIQLDLHHMIKVSDRQYNCQRVSKQKNKTKKFESNWYEIPLDTWPYQTKRPGTDNKADYFSKHHMAKHHRSVHSTYLHQSNALVRECANLQNIQHTTRGVREAYSTYVKDSKVSKKVLPTHMHLGIRDPIEYTSAQPHK